MNVDMAVPKNMAISIFWGNKMVKCCQSATPTHRLSPFCVPASSCASLLRVMQLCRMALLLKALVIIALVADPACSLSAVRHMSVTCMRCTTYFMSFLPLSCHRERRNPNEQSNPGVRGHLKVRRRTFVCHPTWTCTHGLPIHSSYCDCLRS